MNSRSLLPVALVAAIVGGAAAAGAVAIFDAGSKHVTTTVVEQAPLSGTPASDTKPGLTPADIYKKDAPGVVFIQAEVIQQTQSQDPFNFGFPQQQQGEATGSGFVVDKQGHILTNAHVIDGAVKVTVKLADKQVVDAKVIGKDTSSDLAVLKIPTDGVDLTPLPLGSAKSAQVGDPVIAIGNPFGLDRTLTTGVVSAKQRQITAPNNFQISNVLQTDAAINPGNSGGPLIDAQGRVIGINSQIETGGSGRGNVGIGFAVPIDTARQELPQLETDGKVQRAFLGVQTLTIDQSLAALSLPVRQGALVQIVQSGTPADKAGLKGGSISSQLSDGTTIQQGGDIITEVDGQVIKTSDDLAAVIGAKKPGDKVKIDFLRNGKKMTVTATLSSQPSNAQPDDSQQG